MARVVLREPNRLVRMRQDTGDGGNAAGDDFGMQQGKGERCVKPFFPLELGREWLFVTFAIKALVAAASEKARSFLHAATPRC